MHALVTGCQGFIGTHLARRLWIGGHHVTGVDCRPPQPTRFGLGIPAASPRHRFLQGDVNHRDFVDRVFDSVPRFDLVFHLAAVVGVQRTLESPVQVRRDLRGIRNIGRAAARTRVGRLIFTSSSEVYGEPALLPTPETAPPRPLQLYGAVKMRGERLFEALRRTHGLPISIVRLFNVYGPGQDAGRYGFVVANFVDCAYRGARLPIFGDGSQTRDFVYVDDCVRAILLVATSDRTEGTPINIGNGVPTTVVDLAHTLLRLLGTESRGELESLPRRSDIRHRHADASRLKTLGYAPEYDLQAGLRATHEHHRRNTGREAVVPQADGRSAPPVVALPSFGQRASTRADGAP